MPLSQIAVDIASHGNGGSAEQRAALLEACTDSVATAECVSADDVADPAVVALVFWESAGRVHIEVGSKRAPGEKWRVRDLRFGPADARIERWRAVGFAVGTIAGEIVATDASVPPDESAAPATTTTKSTRGNDGASSSSSSPTATETETSRLDRRESAKPQRRQRRSEPEPTPETKEVEPATVSASDSSPERDVLSETAENAHPAKPYDWWADAGAETGQGLSDGAWKIGGFARFSRRLGGPFVTAAFAASVRSRDTSGLSALWLTPSAGIGYAIDAGRTNVVIDGRAEIALEHLGVDIEDANSGRTDTASRWMAAARLGSDLVWTPFDPVGVLLGAEGMARLAATDVEAQGAVIGTVPVLDYLLMAGVRIGWH